MQEKRGVCWEHAVLRNHFFNAIPGITAKEIDYFYMGIYRNFAHAIEMLQVDHRKGNKLIFGEYGNYYRFYGTDNELTAENAFAGLSELNSLLGRSLPAYSKYFDKDHMHEVYLTIDDWSGLLAIDQMSKFIYIPHKPDLSRFSLEYGTLGSGF